MTREKIDIIVHVPLEAEYHEFKEVFRVVEEMPSALNMIARVEAPNGFNVVVVVQEKMGRSFALAACQAALSRFDPRAYICLGIAGCLTKDLSLGDVCYTGLLIDVYDNSKVTDVSGGGIDVALSPEFHPTNRQLTAAMGFVRTSTQLAELYGDWKQEQGELARTLLPAPVMGRDGKVETITEPKCLNGDIVCGPVSESDSYRQRLRGVTRNPLAIETESGPIFAHCSELGVQALTIRGLCDYANAGKGELEGETKDAVRKLAARSASTFLRMQLNNPFFVQALSGLTSGRADEPQLAFPQVSVNPIPGLLGKIDDLVDAKLRELSPQYRTKPVGFRLPAPRVRQEVVNTVAEQAKKPSAQEFVTAVGRHRRSILYVPRTYPDQALPWVLASALMQADVAGKKAIPIVIDGRKVGPPKDNLERLSPVELCKGVEAAGGEYVFIIDEPTVDSRSKVNFLKEDLKAWHGARVVFVTRSEKAVAETAEFTRQLSADEFHLCDVSFSEMAAFLEAAFEMPWQEAEVIALKLKAMFSRFSLPAHPSFFAGIPQEALAALLLANRRSELIQLAVDGFLSFVVATDPDPVRMSRSNRARFLRRLVVEMVLEKRPFTEADLVFFARSISDEFDYGINPITFVQQFVKCGIIHFNNGYACITLPFIESYLFADELNKDAGLAKRYFEADTDDIDLSIFDLYAEIGASKDIIDLVIKSLDEAMGSCEASGEEHVLLDGSVNPAIFSNPARLTNLRA